MGAERPRSLSLPTAEVIDTALRQLLSGSALDALAHSGGGYAQTLSDRCPFTRIGWRTGGAQPVPTVADLLPQDVLAKFLGVSEDPLSP